MLLVLLTGIRTFTFRVLGVWLLYTVMLPAFTFCVALLAGVIGLMGMVGQLLAMGVTIIVGAIALYIFINTL